MPFYAIEIFEKGQVYKSKNGVVKNLALGEPSANFQKILNDLKNKIEEQKFGYTESIGTAELRNES